MSPPILRGFPLLGRVSGPLFLQHLRDEALPSSLISLLTFFPSLRSPATRLLCCWSSKSFLFSLVTLCIGASLWLGHLWSASTAPSFLSWPFNVCLSHVRTSEDWLNYLLRRSTAPTLILHLCPGFVFFIVLSQSYVVYSFVYLFLSVSSTRISIARGQKL